MKATEPDPMEAWLQARDAEKAAAAALVEYVLTNPAVAEAFINAALTRPEYVEFIIDLLAEQWGEDTDDSVLALVETFSKGCTGVALFHEGRGPMQYWELMEAHRSLLIDFANQLGIVVPQQDDDS